MPQIAHQTEIEKAFEVRKQVSDLLSKEGWLTRNQLIRRTRQTFGTIRRTIERMRALDQIEIEIRGCTHYYKMKS